MNKEEARAYYEKDIEAGYSPSEAKDRLGHYAKTGIMLPDPTDRYWDSLVHKESRGKQEAVSPKGATGVAQVMPATGPEAAALAGLEWDPVAFKQDAVYNAKLGRAYFRKQMADNGNDPVKALAAYNAGPGAVRKAGNDLNRLPEETKDYVPSIIGKAEQGMQPDLDPQADINAAQEALMTPRDRARKAYEDALASGASPEEAKAAVMQFVKKAPVAEAPPPAASQVSPITVARGASPVSENDPYVVKMRPKDSEVIAEQLQGNMGDRFSAGVNNSLSGMDRGARKLIGMLTGDEEAVKSSEGETQNVRDVFQKYDPVGSGFSAADAGKLAGDAGSFALAPAGGAGMAGRVLAGTGTGALQGALQPTTADESVAVNAGVGGAVGGGASTIGGMLRGIIGKPDAERKIAADLLRQQGVKVPTGQEYKSPLGSLLRKAGGAEGSIAQSDKSLTGSLAERLGTPGQDITNEGLENNLRRLGPMIGDAHKDFQATPDRKIFKDLIGIGQKYQLSGPKSQTDEVNSMVDHLLNLVKPGNKISGEEYQALRTGLTANSVTGNAAQKQAMGDMKRALDRLFNEQNPKPELPGLRSEYRLSKILRSGAGVPADGFTTRALRNRVESAAGKGEVNGQTRQLINEVSGLMPSSRLGGDAVIGAGDDTALRGLDRPSMLSVLSAIMRAGAAPTSRAFDSGVPHKIVNDDTTRKAVANLLRGMIIPQATPKGEQ